MENLREGIWARPQKHLYWRCLSSMAVIKWHPSFTRCTIKHPPKTAAPASAVSSYGREIGVEDGVLCELVGIVETQAHQEVMGVLRVYERLAVGGLPGQMLKPAGPWSRPGP